MKSPKSALIYDEDGQTKDDITKFSAPISMALVPQLAVSFWYAFLQLQVKRKTKI